LDEIAAHILGHKDDKRVPKLKKSIQYYLDGAKDNAIKNKIKSPEKNKNNIKGKNDLLESTAGVNDTKQLGSEILNLQVISFLMNTHCMYYVFLYLYVMKTTPAIIISVLQILIKAKIVLSGATILPLYF